MSGQLCRKWCCFEISGIVLAELAWKLTTGSMRRRILRHGPAFSLLQGIEKLVKDYAQDTSSAFIRVKVQQESIGMFALRRIGSACFARN